MRTVGHLVAWTMPVLVLACSGNEFAGDSPGSRGGKGGGSDCKGVDCPDTDDANEDGPGDGVHPDGVPGGSGPGGLTESNAQGGPGSLDGSKNTGVPGGLNNGTDSGTQPTVISGSTGTTVSGPTITTGDADIALVGTSTAGIAFDGKASVCLDWKAGTIIVTKLYDKYFAFSGSYETTSVSGKKETVRMTGAGTYKLPGTWGAAVCDATASNTGFKATTAGNRENQPIISTRKTGTQACFMLDDAEGDRGGAVTLHGVNFNVKKC